jgi:hypothetical protein
MVISYPSKSCLIKLTDNCLFVANDGQPFSRSGVISICASHLSTKDEHQLTDPDLDGPDSNLVSAIRDRELKTYHLNPDRIISDYRGDEETRLDYGGRSIWELLQNADDAMAPTGAPKSQLIGVKGIGFKSILEISGEPEIHSGSFHFRFSSEKTSSTLKASRLASDPPPLTFRIPFEARVESDTSELLENFVTVIRLPLSAGKKERVFQWLNELDHRVLLFCQYMEEVTIEIPNEFSKIWKVSRIKPGELCDSDLNFELIGYKGTAYKPKKYRRWAKTWEPGVDSKRLSVSICLPLDENENPIPEESPMPLHVFFPTREILPFRSLIHVSFDLEQNRKHVRDGKHDDRLIDELGTLLRRIIQAEIPVATLLKAFVPIPQEMPEEKSPAGQLWARFSGVLKEEKFVPLIGERRDIPSKCHSWEYNLGDVLDSSDKHIIESGLISTEIQKDNSCRAALSVLGVPDLRPTEYPKLMIHCSNRSIDQCEKALEVLHSIILDFTPPNYVGNGTERENFLDTSRRVGCWWTQKEVPRALKSDAPFFKRKPQAETTPQWLPIEYLHEDILEVLETLDGGKDPSWEAFLQGHLFDTTNEELLHCCLLPALKGQDDQAWWNQFGKDVLVLYKKWAPQTGHGGLIWQDKKRLAVGRSLCVPTDKGWLPAFQCYAGAAWDGPSSFDKHFENVPDRGLLMPPEKWPISITANNVNGWTNCLKYAGVSWEMKIVHWEVEKGNGWEISKNTIGWKIPCPFETGVNLDHWSKYCEQLSPLQYGRNSTKFDCKATAHEQWAIEHFPDALPAKSVERLKLVQPIGHDATGQSMRYTHEKAVYGGRTYGESITSFSHWQLLDLDWLKCKPSIFHTEDFICPRNAYMPGRGLRGLLPTVEINIPKGQEGRDLETFLTQVLKVQEDLPSSGSPKWNEWLSMLPDRIADVSDHDALKGNLRFFFKALFSLDEKPAEFPQQARVPSVHLVKEEVGSDYQERISFMFPTEIFWLDKPYFAESKTYNELLKQFNIFVSELNEGEKAEEWFGIKKLSNIVKISPIYGSEHKSLGEKVISRYRARFVALKVIGKQIDLPDPDKVLLKVVENLKLDISANGRKVASPRVNYWVEDGEILLDSENYYRGISTALVSSSRDLSDVFENVLKARDQEEVIERLRDKGIPETALKDLEDDLSDIGNGRLNEEEKRSPSDFDEGDIGKNSDDALDKTSEEEHEYQLKEGRNVKGNRPTDDKKNALRNGNGETTSPKRDTKGPNVSQEISQDRKEKGQHAEQWIKARLKEELGEDWNISGPEQDHLGRESDLVLRCPGFREFHIEVKHMESDSIFWSQREVEKSKDYPGNYLMVICCPERDGDTDSSLKEYWLTDPLNELKDFEKDGVWLWQGSEKITLMDQGWDIPKDIPARDANNFSFHIKIFEQKLKDLTTKELSNIINLIKGKI